MSVRALWVGMILLSCSAVCYGKETRWKLFAEDSDLRYYLDEKSVVTLPDHVYLFWIKSVAKNKEFYRRQYNLNDLAYILTNYELDCAAATYRVRGALMYDSNRNVISKTLPSGGAVPFEPIPPESVMEMAQDSFCSKAESAPAAAPEPVPDAEEPSGPAQPAPAEPPSIQ